jgi:hypothetical protein
VPTTRPFLIAVWPLKVSGYFAPVTSTAVAMISMM